MDFNVSINPPMLNTGFGQNYPGGVNVNMGPGYPMGVNPVAATTAAYMMGAASAGGGGMMYPPGGPMQPQMGMMAPPPAAFPPGTGPGASFPIAGADTTPSAPMPTFPGYAGGGWAAVVQPPVNPYFQPEGGEPELKREIPTSASITPEEAKEALKKFADDKCCAEKADGYEITGVEMKSAFQYHLKSFTEHRETVWEFEPYIAQTLDGPAAGGVPGPWDVVVQPTKSFSGDKKKVKIPGTSSIRPCHKCYGFGKTRCSHCNGAGMPACTWCHGKGQDAFNAACTHCNSSGRQPCTWCNSQGFENCKLCHGKGQMFVYLQLKAEWKVADDEFVSESDAIPKKKLSKAKGVRVLSEKYPRVTPLNDFPDQAVSNSSKDLIQQHSQKFAGQAMILEQEQFVDIVRICEVAYRSSDKVGKFYVYGTDNKVYFEDYPSKCCCTIV